MLRDIRNLFGKPAGKIPVRAVKIILKYVLSKLIRSKLISIRTSYAWWYRHESYKERLCIYIKYEEISDLQEGVKILGIKPAGRFTRVVSLDRLICLFMTYD